MAKRPAGGITSATTDTETGTDGDQAIERDLYALKVMRDRGLITAAEFEARQAELHTGRADDLPGDTGS